MEGMRLRVFLFFREAQCHSLNVNLVLGNRPIMMNEICPVCQSALSIGYRAWHWLCESCGYEKANGQPIINLHSAHQINEDIREKGLRALRVSNFKKLLISIKSLKPDGGRLLDVGCGHGWFLETANNDFTVLGVEPDRDHT